MSLTKECIVAMGANQALGELTPRMLLEASLEAMEEKFVDVAAASGWYETPAFPAGSGPNYVNGVARVVTQFSPHQTLEKLHEIELRLGRTRQKRWESRVCDLDLISFGSDILPDLDTYRYWQALPLEHQMTQAPETLILPHPRVLDRAFVLVPLLEIAPDWVHPVTGERVKDIVASLPVEDKEAIKPLTE